MKKAKAFIVLTIVIISIISFTIQSFATIAYATNKPHVTPITNKDGYAQITLDVGSGTSTEVNSFLYGKTLSMGSVSQYSKYARACIYTSKPNHAPLLDSSEKTSVTDNDAEALAYLGFSFEKDAGLTLTDEQLVGLTKEEN